jgi:cytochrome c-type biogenesis protein CcmE
MTPVRTPLSGSSATSGDATGSPPTPGVGSPAGRRRTKFIVGAGLILVMLIGLMAWAMARPGSTSFYLTPTELTAKGSTPAGQIYRVNGTVVPGTVQRSGLHTAFTITDGTTRLAVATNQPLPSAFKNGADVVAGGYYDGTSFKASQVLAKCPSKFTPQKP